MRSVDDTVAAIDAAVDGCAQCGRELGSSPSDAFCSEFCQARWLRDRTASPEDVLGQERTPHQGASHPGVMVGRLPSRRDSAFPPAVVCGHCVGMIRRFPTIHGRTQVVNAQPDPARGNIQWLPAERVCVQLGADPAAARRSAGLPLFVFHGLDCRETLARSSRNPRPRGERPAPSANEGTRARLREQLAAQLGWRPGGSWRWRR